MGKLLRILTVGILVLNSTLSATNSLSQIEGEREKKTNDYNDYNAFQLAKMLLAKVRNETFIFFSELKKVFS